MGKLKYLISSQGTTFNTERYVKIYSQKKNTDEKYLKSFKIHKEIHFQD